MSMFGEILNRVQDVTHNAIRTVSVGAGPEGEQVIQGKPVVQTGLSAGTLNADLVASTDVGTYRAVSLQIMGTWVGTLTFQASNDGTNWDSLLMSKIDTVGAPASTTASAGIFYTPVRFKYLRVRMTAYSSGTATGVMQLHTLPSDPISLGVAAAQSGSWSVGQTGTWTVQPGNTANTTAWLVRDVAAGGLSSNQVSVGTAATSIIAARTSRKAVIITNLGTTDVFIGASTVTTSNGLLLQGVKGESIVIPTSAQVYGIVGTGTQSVSVLEAF